MTANPYQSPENESDLPKQQVSWAKFGLKFVTVVAVLGLIIALLLPLHRGGARESARRASCANNLHNIALALRSYESDFHCLPPAYTVDASGQPLHSWRTLILPYIEQKELYKKIDLSKAWDDPANQEAYNARQPLYACPSSVAGRGKTTFFAVVAPGGCFQPTKSISFAEIKDRRDLTLLVIEVSDKYAAHWMSPQDATEEMILNREADGEFPHPGGSQAAFVDGSVRYLSGNVPADVLQAMISIDGGDDVVARQQ
ncbi:MAG TPA: DUF1559 domain-containing protein [Pirellulaceae bacterium]|jgi:prepilin-type processing-associated H-X9-DG protein